ncbi:sensor histidine kinase [Sinomicrobium weinanense]|uniref:histidine kinase n=1 Tax=Sinomicrobium weinanense TaxID=2842200 RepID=A0A926JNN0_9FLAO|nr:HAMP domain-containing sensor histidine kinase [Sinomicrobium weinanense]MBC9794451.1 HAMP domain-containing histidine kinase [Sinomicrobium weinanense]MBU3124358.1 HAMP domain-containing histidine kinase [Sinomicrobium weinanense]
MKLLNQSLKYLSVFILVIISAWSVIFYINMLDEIYDSIDDGLDNYKLLILKKAEKDPAILHKTGFDESNYAIIPIDKEEALRIRDTYKDTLLYMPYEDDKEPVRMLTSAFEHKGDYYKLEVMSSMVEEDDLMEDLFWSIVWLYVALIVSVLIINNLVLRKLWRPFYQLLDHLKAFRINKAFPLPEIQTGTKEFKELKRTCDMLIKHTMEAYSNQKQFTENAAHELQTPLAIISNKLELLLEKNSMESADAEVVSETLQIVSTLTQLNRSLLLLSKIENKQFFDNKEISVNHLVHQVVENLGDFARFKEVDINIEEKGQASLSMDDTLANILISNLVKNAVFHNLKGGYVNIEVRENKLVVRNSSPHGKMEEKDLFKRFFRKNQSQQSTGLGLAIVKAICRLYGFSITYSYREEHCFTVEFH